MKIAYISPTFPPIAAGMGTACFYAANHLAKDHQVTVFLAKKKNINYLSGNYQIKLFKPWFSYGYADLVPNLFWQLKNFDIIHLYYPYFGIAEFLCFFKKISAQKKPKIIFHYQMDMVGEGLSKIVNQLHQKIIAPWLFKTVDAVFVLSADYAQNSNLKKYWKKYKEKFFIVPNGVDLDKFSNQNKAYSAGLKINLKANEQIIFTAQALDRQHFFKGIDVLIKALKIINRKNIKLILAGDGDLKKYYQDLAQRFNLQQQIIFLGQINHNFLPSYYQLADVVVVPSVKKTESFSITAAEAMATGKPVIVSNLPGLRVTPENNVSGLLAEPNNEKDLAEKILFLLDNQELRMQMGQAAQKRAREFYDWQKICQKIENYYQKILKDYV